MEPFKEWMNPNVIKIMGGVLKRVYSDFDTDAFIEGSCKDLSSMELKERMQHVMQSLDVLLPADFDSFASIVRGALHPDEDTYERKVEFGPEGLTGFATWPLTDLVTKRGIMCPEKALPVLKEVTKRFSAEFAIRPFLAEHTDYTLHTLESWLGDSNWHVRRLISEGSRPRLPWGIRLHDFVADPSPIMPLLDRLKDDPEEYVRRSVANNLNDIAKDHPEKVADIAKEWLEGANHNRKRLVRHACRTLIKQGHKTTLDAFGYNPVKGVKAKLDISTPVVKYGDNLVFAFSLSEGSEKQPIMIDYAVHFMKANGRTAPKVFKWKDTVLDKVGGLSAVKKHAIKPITTRQYYAGEHQVEIFVNGQSVAIASFELVMDGA